MKKRYILLMVTLVSAILFIIAVTDGKDILICQTGLMIGLILVLIGAALVSVHFRRWNFT